MGKNRIKDLFIGFSLIVCVIFCPSCMYQEPYDEGGHAEGESYVEYQTQYTEEEHIAKISALTKEKFAKSFESGEIVDFEVEILYDFYENPRFFMIDIFRSDIHVKPYDQKYIIGTIRNDEYKSMEHVTQYFGWRYGKNPYDYFGLGEERKYYAPGMCAVKTDAGMMRFYSWFWNKEPIGENPGYENTERVIIEKEDFAGIIENRTALSRFNIWYNDMF